MAKLTDEDLAAKLNAGIRQATGFTESRLSKERERVSKFREGYHPLPLSGSNSKYVSMDVWDAVENMKAQLLEVFSGNNQPGSFPPINAADVGAAQVATDYTTQVIFEQNPGFAIFQSVIDDGLTGRAAVAKVWWQERFETEAYEMSDAAIGDLHAYMAENPDVDIKTIDLSEDGQVIHRAEIMVKVDKSFVKIEPLPPEEFLISAMSKNIKEAALVVHKRPMTASALVKEGYKKSVVDKLQDTDEGWLNTDPEIVLRFQETDDILGMRQDEMGQKSRRTIMLYECYTELDEDDTGRAELYKVVLAGDTILDKERASRKPFIAFVPLPRPHAFWGHSYARLVMPTQAARTYLTRSIIDAALITNNPRYGVVRGGLMNPRELMENRIGGIVNMTRPDAVFPLPQASLNPFVFQTISMLDTNKESITGISSLATGLNKDAISTQNSGDMVDQLISVSQIRQKIVARNFATGFLTDLYRMVYQLVCENENREKIIAVAGSWVPIDPKTWPSRDNLEVDFALGYGEQDKESAKWIQIDAYLSKNEAIAPLYPIDKQYQVVAKAMKYKGIKDISTYLLDPSQVKPPQPTPMMLAELALKQADAAAKNAAAQSTAEKMKLDQQAAVLNQQIENGKLQLEHLKVQAQIQQAKDELAHKVSVDALQGQLQIQAQAQDKLTAIAE